MRRGTKALILLAIVVAGAFLAFLLAATDVHFVPQVVDLYLICQYARAMAEGHPFHYNAGEPASSGATSLLHTAVLALAHALGARGEGLVAFAILLGAGLFVAAVLLARRIGVLLSGEREGFLAGALVCLGGPVVWGFLYGSDIALFMFLSLWLLERLLLGWNRGSFQGIALPGMLLSLARPEGLPIALLVGGAWTAGPGRAARGRERVLAWLPAAAGGAVLALQKAVTGQWLGTSVADKSLFANYSIAEALGLVADYGVDVLRGLLLGFYPAQTPIGFAKGWAPLVFPPLGLVLVLLAVARPPQELRAPVRLWAAVVALLFALLAPNMFMGVHFNRYLLWAFPSLLVLTAAGLGVLTRIAARGDEGLERALFRAGAGLCLALGLLSTLRFATLYGEMAGEVYRRDVKAAEWIARNLPQGVAMANLATSVEYLTGHRATNLHGVTSPAFFGNRTAEREAGVFEALGRLPVAERPGFLITTVATQEGNATLRRLVADEPLFQSNSLSDEILIYKMQYDLVGKNGRLFLPETLAAVAGLREVDRLNVCDSVDEAAHGYVFRSRLGNLRLNGTARISSYESPPEELIDAGRVILGGESFQVRTSRGKDLLIVMRTAAAASANVRRAGSVGVFGFELSEAGLVVEIDGHSVTRLAVRPKPGWDEQLLRIPAVDVAEGETRLDLSGRYASFFYWFFQ